MTGTGDPDENNFRRRVGQKWLWDVCVYVCGGTS